MDSFSEKFCEQVLLFLIFWQFLRPFGHFVDTFENESGHKKCAYNQCFFDFGHFPTFFLIFIYKKNKIKKFFEKKVSKRPKCPQST